MTEAPFLEDDGKYGRSNSNNPEILGLQMASVPVENSAGTVEDSSENGANTHK